MTLKSLFSAGALITAGMLTGRLLGLLRETLIASHFGINAGADMAIMLLIIPDFITSALIGGAASATLIPAFASRGHDSVLALFWQSMLASVIAFTFIAMLIFLQNDHIRSMMSPEVAELPKGALAFFIALCSLPLSAATSIFTAYLQYRGRFVAPAFANAIFNMIVILTLLIMPVGLAIFAGGILFATMVRLLAHAGAFLRISDARRKPVMSPLQMDKTLAKTYMHTAGSGILGMLPYYAPYAVIAYVGSSIALFNYSFKLVLLPGMLLQTLVQMLLLPWFVRITTTADAETAGRSYSISLQISVILSFVVSISLSLVGPSVAAICFGYGKMNAEAVAQVGQLFSIGVWAMPGMVLSSVWQQILYANNRTSIPLVSSALQAFLVTPLCWLGYVSMGPAGVLAAYIIIQSFPVLILVWEGVRCGIIKSLSPSLAYGQMVLASAVVFLPLAMLEQYLSLSTIASIAIAIVIGLISLAAGLFASQPIRHWAMQRVRRI